MDYTILMLQLISAGVVAIVFGHILHDILLALIIYPRLKSLVEQVITAQLEINKLLVLSQSEANAKLLAQLSGKLKAIAIVPSSSSPSSSPRKRLLKDHRPLDSAAMRAYPQSATIEVPIAEQEVVTL